MSTTSVSVGPHHLAFGGYDTSHSVDTTLKTPLCHMLGIEYPSRSVETLRLGAETIGGRTVRNRLNALASSEQSGRNWNSR